MKAAYLLTPLLLCTVGCAYTNPTQPSPAAPSTTSPASLTVGADRGHISIHVQNAYGTPLANIVVNAYADTGELSDSRPVTSRSGIATTTWLGHGTTHVAVVVDTLTANYLVVVE